MHEGYLSLDIWLRKQIPQREDLQCSILTFVSSESPPVDTYRKGPLDDIYLFLLSRKFIVNIFVL